MRNRAPGYRNNPRFSRGRVPGYTQRAPLVLRNAREAPPLLRTRIRAATYRDDPDMKRPHFYAGTAGPRQGWLGDWGSAPTFTQAHAKDAIAGLRTREAPPLLRKRAAHSSRQGLQGSKRPHFYAGSINWRAHAATRPRSAPGFTQPVAWAGGPCHAGSIRQPAPLSATDSTGGRGTDVQAD